MAWQTTHVAETWNACPYNATKTFQQPLVGQKHKDQTYRLVTNPCTAWHKHLKQEHSNNRWLDKRKETKHIDWSQLHAQHGTNLYITRTFQQPLVGQKQIDQTYRLVTDPCTAWHKHNKTRTFQQPLVGQKPRDQTYKLVTNPCTAWHKHIIIDKTRHYMT